MKTLLTPVLERVQEYLKRATRFDITFENFENEGTWPLALPLPLKLETKQLAAGYGCLIRFTIHGELPGDGLNLQPGDMFRVSLGLGETSEGRLSFMAFVTGFKFENGQIVGYKFTSDGPVVMEPPGEKQEDAVAT